jgi:endogenous inhibitor of DNA gyrase (YacG/DUF329 family)
MSNPPAKSQPPKVRPCPVCRKPAVAAHAPFCSAACRDRDLIAWLDERYVVPGRPASEEGDHSDEG